MREALIAIGVFALIALTGWALHSASMIELVVAGGVLMAAGFIFGIPCAVWYHWLLYRTLKPRGALDKRWLLSPTRHHDRLRPGERSRVLWWFYAGAAGWGVVVLGCVVAGLGLIVGRNQ